MPERGRAAAKGAALGSAITLLGAAACGAHGLMTDRAAAGMPRTPTSTAIIQRTDVRQQTVVTGTLGYAGSYTVIAPAAPSTGSAVMTWLPAAGATVTRGHPVYEVDGIPVPLMYGRRPAWRAMGAGVTGPDVRQLQQNLIALGFGAGVAPTGTFDQATAWATARWQRAAGLPVTGTVPLGQVAFLPGPLLVGALAASAGAVVSAGTPILSGTGTQAAVGVQLDPAVAPFIQARSKVTVMLPDGRTVPGTVISVSRVAVASASGQQQGSQQGPQALVPAEIRLMHSDGGELDQAPVQVTIISAEQRDALAVPITALLARPGGQFTVVVVSRASQRPVRVTTGLFDQTAGIVAVTGPGLAAGQRVEVPSQ